MPLFSPFDRWLDEARALDFMRVSGRWLGVNRPDQKVHVNVLIHAETLWLPLARIAELFDVQVPGISKHLKNIFDTGELSREATVSKMEIVQTEGGRSVRRNIDYYNLDAIVAVGYRVNSKRATQFRIWATQILTENIKKGFFLPQDLVTEDYLGIKFFATFNNFLTSPMPQSLDEYLDYRRLSIDFINDRNRRISESH